MTYAAYLRAASECATIQEVHQLIKLAARDEFLSNTQYDLIYRIATKSAGNKEV
jgi:hypothetical protein